MTRFQKFNKKYNQPVVFSNQQISRKFQHPEINKFFCFRCRKEGHSVKDCNQTTKGSENQPRSSAISAAHGFCYICGATDHSSKTCRESNSQSTNNDAIISKYKFATCFVCKEKGHISAECPQNSNGIYPNGGGCRHCGSKRHLAKDCRPTEQDKSSFLIGLVSESDFRDGTFEPADVDDVHIALQQMEKERSLKKILKSSKDLLERKNKIVKF